MQFKLTPALQNSVLAFTSATLLATSAFATDRYVATSGSDGTNDCTAIATPCATLQQAINQSTSGDVINMAAGTYFSTNIILVNKTLSILGAQAGIDARYRSGVETVLSNTQGIAVSASNVLFDGLTIQDSKASTYPGAGFGIWITPGVDGTQIINNIFQNNISGIGLSNLGNRQCLIQHNLFQNNNLSGSAFGTGIYTDQYVGGSVSNVLINENRLTNNQNAGIGLNSMDMNYPTSLLTITNNSIDNCGRGIFFYNTQLSSVTNNSITNLSAPTDGGSSVGIGIYGAVSDLTISRNNIQTGVKHGVRIGTFMDGSPSPSNTNISIHLNNIFGFANAAMSVDVPPSGPAPYATCNWWGNSTGPKNPTLNPSGMGDSIQGNLTISNFNPWLSNLGPDATCGQAPTLGISFSPSTIKLGGNSTLIMTLNNPNSVPAQLIAPLTDHLPAGITIVGNATTTCGTTNPDKKIKAIPGSSMISLLEGQIPANGSCMVTVVITSSQKGNYSNTLPAGALQTHIGSNSNAAYSGLTVNAVKPMN